MVRWVPGPQALARPLETIIETARDLLDEAPPEIVADLMENGVCLAGGGSLLQGLDRRLSEELRLRAWVAEDPVSAVARGAGMVLEDLDRYRRLLIDAERYLG